MEIPEEYTVTHTDEPFLLYDSGIDSPARILIFSTETNLRALTTTGHWFADGQSCCCFRTVSNNCAIYIVYIFTCKFYL
jgi:hypothetical protein